MAHASGSAPRFIGARLNRAAVIPGYGVAAISAASRFKLEVQVPPDDLIKLRELGDNRSILLPNHPTPHDWLCMFQLSSRLGTPFHYMTAHEQMVGLRRHWLPLFGAYSVRRGGCGDRRSVAESLKLLDGPRCRLVLFAEGRCSFNSTGVIGFKNGAVKIGFRYLMAAARTQTQVPNLLLVPITLRYQYLEPIDASLEKGIVALERHLGTSATGTLSARLANLARQFVASLGAHLDTTPGAWSDQIGRLCDTILGASEARLGIAVPPRRGIDNRACNIRQVLALEGYDHGVTDEAKYRDAYYPTLLALVLETLTGYPLDGEMTTSQRADLLWLLERAVYRIPDPAPRGRRRVTIRAGDCVNLKDRLAEFQADRHGATRRIVSEIQASVRHNLDGFENEVPSVTENRQRLDSALRR